VSIKLANRLDLRPMAIRIATKAITATAHPSVAKLAALRFESTSLREVTKRLANQVAIAGKITR
jgi:precorrin isomerase